MTNPTPHGQVPEALRIADEFKLCSEFDSIPSIIDIEKAEAELRRQHTRIAELEAQIAAVGAGGVQALSAAPAGWKLVPVEPTNEMQKAADEWAAKGFDWPKAVYRAMLAASPTPPAEQQAITPETGNYVSAQGAAITSESGAVYAELCCDEVSRAVDVVVERCISLTQDATGIKVVYDPIILANALRTELRGFADRTHALRMEQAAPKAAPVVWLSSKQLRGVTALHGQYLPFRCQPEGRFDTPVYLVEAAPKAAPGEPFDECFPGEPRVAVPQGLISAACFAIRNKRDGGKVLEQLRRYSVGDLSQPLAPQQEAQEPATTPRFNCWSTNEGDSWFDHPADAQAIYDCLGNDAKVGDEYELTAGWKSVTARYRITEIVGDGEEYEVECISHQQGNTAPQPAPAPLSDDTERLEWLLWKLPGDALRYVVGELADTSSGAEFRAAIDAAIAAQKDTP